MPERLIAIAALALLLAAPASGQHAPSAPSTQSAATPPPTDRGDAVHAPGAPGAAAGSPTDLASALLDGFPPEALGFGPRLGPRYALSRWSEDWSYLRDPAARKDFFDPVKFVRLSDDGSAYLTLSAEARLRSETYSNPGLRNVESQDSELVRTFIGADLHLGEHIRGYGELANGQQYGRVPDNVNQRNDLVLQQLFVEAKQRLGDADAGLMIGRQDFVDGPVQLVSVRENNNIHTTFQGARAYANWRRARIDLFSLHYINLKFHGFDDEVSHTMRLDGALASVIVTPRSVDHPFFVDPFVFRSTDDNRRWGTTTTREERDFYGVRARGRVGPATLDWYAAYQTGHYGTRPLSAWSASADQSLPLGDNAWKPAIGFHVDAGSGGGAFGTGTLHDADFLFGTNPYLNDSKTFGFINLVDIAPTLTFVPAPRVTVRAEYQFLRRLKEDDAVYSGIKVAYAGTQRVSGKVVGQQARLRVAWAVDPHVTLAGTVERVFAGSVLERSGFTDSTFTSVQATLKF